MAEPLKTHFGERIPREMARQIAEVWPPFRVRAFVREALDGYDALELMDRGRHLARVLRRYLPEAYPDALAVLIRSVDTKPERMEGDGGMASFFYLPHVSFVAQFGLDDFEASMAAQHLLTQRFTAEFSVRPFIERYERESLGLLRKWARDPHPHVRRLVSEGTRPRLPWAGRLRRFQQDPTPVLDLLELLKDDPELYVRRSVANNLNDIGKDHPDVLLAVARRWLVGAGSDRRALVRHALRSLVKQGNAEALGLLGFGGRAKVTVEQIRIAPVRVAKGGKVALSFVVRSTSRQAQQILVDLRVYYVKANGGASPKVFKLRAVDLAAGAELPFRKMLSLADLTTRRHHPGRHRVEALVNGRAEPLGTFTLTA